MAQFFDKNDTTVVEMPEEVTKPSLPIDPVTGNGLKKLSIKTVIKRPLFKDTPGLFKRKPYFPSGRFKMVSSDSFDMTLENNSTQKGKSAVKPGALPKSDPSSSNPIKSPDGLETKADPSKLEATGIAKAEKKDLVKPEPEPEPMSAPALNKDEKKGAETPLQDPTNIVQPEIPKLEDVEEDPKEKNTEKKVPEKDENKDSGLEISEGIIANETDNRGFTRTLTAAYEAAKEMIKNKLKYYKPKQGAVFYALHDAVIPTEELTSASRIKRFGEGEFENFANPTKLLQYLKDKPVTSKFTEKNKDSIMKNLKKTLGIKD